MSSSTARPSWRVLAGALVLLVAALPVAVAEGSATRSLSATSVSCGDTIHVTVDLSPPDGTDSWLAEEFVPSGWTVSGASGGLTQQTDTGVKFTGAGGSDVTLSYDLEVPSDASGTFAVTGEHRFHPAMDTRAATGGTEEISVSCDTGGTDDGSSDDSSSGDSSTAAARTLPSQATCGDTLTVTVELTPPSGTESWLAEEVVPSGWTVSNPSGGLSSMTDTGVKFTGAGDGAVTLTYDVTVPDAANGSFAITGEHRFHPSMDTRAATGGSEAISVDCSTSGDDGSGDEGSDNTGSATAGATRTLPSQATCGDTITVELAITPPNGTDSWLAEEFVPSGATVVSSSGALSTTTDTGIKFTGAGDASTTITYQVSLPDSAVGDEAFSGEHRFSPSMDARADSGGDGSVSVSCADGPAVRSLSSSVSCGDTLAVSIDLAPPEGTDSWLVEEFVPSGMTVQNPSGALSTITDTGVKFTGAGSSNVTLTYELAVDENRTDAISLDGEYRFHPSMDARANVVGDTVVPVDCGDQNDGSVGPPAGVHPFDANGDCQMVDTELFNLIDAWIGAHVDGGPSDAQLFDGIMAWKQPGSYC